MYQFAEKTVPATLDGCSNYRLPLLCSFVHASLFLQLCIGDDNEAAVQLCTGCSSLQAEKDSVPIKQPIRQTSGNQSDIHLTFTVIHAGDDDT